MSLKTVKLAIYDFAGQQRSAYEVEIDKVVPKASNSKSSVGHHIIVIDRSGSMRYDIEDLKETVVKVLTLDEYQNSDMLVSLISYSTDGDVTLHFERVVVSDVMKTGSPHVKEIRKIRATCLTCISQAMEMAEELLRDDELSAITLHSDGYANDPNPSGERRSLDAICERLSSKNVFVNTIAYSDYSDFVLLSKIANSVSGNCVKARSTKEVYDALQEACNALASNSAVSLEVVAGDADYVLFASNEPRKIIGSRKDMTVKGVTDAGGVVFRFREIEEELPKPEGRLEDGEAEFALLAMARAKLAAGNLNAAKFAMISTLNASLSAHARALTANQIAEMSADLENRMFESGSADDAFFGKPGLGNEKTSVIEVIGALHKHRSDILLDIEELKRGYRHRGLKRVQGKRNEDGSVESPWVDTEYASDSRWVNMGPFDVNRNAATVNLLVTRPVKLVERESRKEISEVAGVLLDKLSAFNNYTVVGDGELNLDSMRVRFSNKRAFKALQALGILPECEYSHETSFEIDLRERPVCPYWFDPKDLAGAFVEAAQLKVVISALSAMVKDSSAEYSKEQVEELKRHCLSTSLNVNFPTVNEYEDLNEAISAGIVDTRTGYKIEIGSVKILSVGKFKSANAFLDRRYEVSVDGEKVKKPKMTELLRDGVSLEYKALSSRAKVDAAENLQMGIFDEIVGNNAALPTLSSLMDSDTAKSISQRTESAEELVETIESALSELRSREDAVWREKISPLVFFIGSTGLIPDGIDAKAMTADELTAAYPDISLSKSEKEGTFFVFGNTVITVYSKTEYFSTGRKADESEQQQVATAIA